MSTPPGEDEVEKSEERRKLGSYDISDSSRLWRESSGLMRSTSHLEAAARTLADRCVDGITANRAHLEQGVRGSVGIVTALSPALGYATSAEIAKESLATGRWLVVCFLLCQAWQASLRS